MKVLVIGSGGREHALCWRLSQSKEIQEVYCAPGNPGTAEIAENLPISVDDISSLVETARSKEIDLTLVGPEYPLTLGVVDAFQDAGLRVFGPTKAAATLEGSKAFAKEIMTSCGVPTASYKEFDQVDPALKYLSSVGAPIVVKADGLAAGKGVYVCSEISEAEQAIQTLLQTPGSKVVIEECLEGREASFIAAVAGGVIVPLASSHDYKRIGDGDSGPNTGGMGTVSPTPRLSDDQESEIVEQILRPVVAELAKRGVPFCGFLYAGLMIDSDGQYHVLEFNTRLGDPEAQVILRRMDFDFAKMLLDLLEGRLSESDCSNLSWSSKASVCLVLAASGYPQKPKSGDVISGILEASALDDVEVFHAGTGVSEQGALVTRGGRVLNVTTLGTSVEDARIRAYEAAKKVNFAGLQMRSDIALNG